MRLNKSWGIAFVILGLVVLTGAVIDFVQPGKFLMGKVAPQVSELADNLGGIGDWSFDDKNAVSDSGSQVIDFKDVKKLVLDNKVGKISVTGDANANQATVNYVKKVNGLSESEARNLLAKVKIDFSRNGDAQTVNTNFPDSEFLKTKRLHVDFEIVLPAAAALEMHNNVGEVKTRGMHGAVKAEVNVGKVDIDGYKDTLFINSSTGEVKARGGADIKSVDITAHVGAVEFAVPPNANLDVNADTNVGTVNSDFDFGGSTQFVGKSMHGKIGEGTGGQVHLRTNTGAINISKE